MRHLAFRDIGVQGAQRKDKGAEVGTWVFFVFVFNVYVF